MNPLDLLAGEVRPPRLFDVAGGRFAACFIVGALTARKTAALTQQVQDLARDTSVDAILLAVSSPGGETDGIPRFADVVRSARSYKPVVAQIEGVGASAAYWVTSQADWVYASTSLTVIGSIGAVCCIPLDHDGAHFAVIRSGHRKAATVSGEIPRWKWPSMPQPLEAERATATQEYVSEITRLFAEAVAEARGLTAEQLARAVDDGAEHLAEQAVRLGLIDGVQPMERTVAELFTRRSSQVGVV